MLAWAAEHPDQLGEDVTLETAALGEDALYAIAADFMATDERLSKERLEADRSVGIQRFDVDGQAFEIIDLGRVEAGVMDARITRWYLPEPAPVFLRLSPDLEDAGASGLEALLATLGPALQSVTIVLEATSLEAAPGTVLLPDVLLSWAGEHKLAVPGANRGDESELTSLAEGVETGGALLAVPHAGLLSTTHVSALAQRYKVRGIELGSSTSVAALADLVWAGVLGPEVELTWAAVAAQYVRTGRASLATLSGQSALAVAKLRRIGATAAPPPPPARRERPKTGGGRPVRIKA
jgi:hypothetical protein